MEAHAFQVHLQFPPLSTFTRRTKELKVCAKRNVEDGNPSLASNKVQRRVILGLVGLNLIFGNSVLAAPMQEMKEPDVLRTLKLASGVRIQDACRGTLLKDKGRKLVKETLSNGYFVHSTVDQFSGESSPVILPLDDEQIIRGLKEVLIGMKVGGKRRALVPPSVGYISDSLQPIPEEVQEKSSCDMELMDTLEAPFSFIPLRKCIA